MPAETTERRYELKGPKQRPYKRWRIAGKRTAGVYADSDPDYRADWSIERLNRWFEAYFQDTHQAEQSVSGGFRVQAEWTLGAFLETGYDNAVEAESVEDYTIDTYDRRLRSIRGHIGPDAYGEPLNNGCPLTFDAKLKDIDTDTLVDFVRWRMKNKPGIHAQTPITDLDTIGKMIKLARPRGADVKSTASPYRYWRGLVQAVELEVRVQPHKPRNVGFDARQFRQIGMEIDHNRYSNRRRAYLLRDVFAILCFTAMDPAELGRFVPATHLVKLVREVDELDGLTYHKVIRWEDRERWADTDGFMAFDLRYDGDGDEIGDFTDGEASRKRGARGLRLIAIADQYTGSRLVEICEAVDPNKPVFADLHHNTFRRALQDCIKRLDMAKDDRKMAKATTSSCRKTFSQWATLSGVPETLAKQHMAHAAGDIHNKHYKFLDAAEAFDIAAKISSIGAGKALHTVLIKAGRASVAPELYSHSNVIPMIRRS